MLAPRLARHLPGLLQGRGLPPFRHRDLGALMALSRYSAYGTLGAAGVLPGHCLSRHVAQLGHGWLHLRHQAEVQGVWRIGGAWLTECLQQLAFPPIRLS